MKLARTIQRLTSGVPLTIVALGDSLTYGWMVRKGYLDYLDEMIKKKYPRAVFSILNRGIPGDTAEGGYIRVRRDVTDESPDLVLVQFALNDAFCGVSPGRFEQALRNIVHEIKENSEAEILLVTSVPVLIDGMEDIAEEMYQRMKNVADQEGVEIAEVHRYWLRKIREGVEFSQLVQFDQVHPTSEGYRYMAEAILEKL